MLWLPFYFWADLDYVCPFMEMLFALAGFDDRDTP